MLTLSSVFAESATTTLLVMFSASHCVKVFPPRMGISALLVLWSYALGSLISTGIASSEIFALYAPVTLSLVNFILPHPVCFLSSTKSNSTKSSPVFVRAIFPPIKYPYLAKSPIPNLKKPLMS